MTEIRKLRKEFRNEVIICKAFGFEIIARVNLEVNQLRIFSVLK